MAPRLLVMPASVYVLPVIRKAQALGLEVVATDIDPRAPGLQVADHAELASLQDAESILEIARRHAVRGIVTEQTDAGVRTAALVAERLGLPGPGVEVARRATDKWAMREACREAGLPLPMYRKARSAAEAMAAAEEIGGPVVLKPSDGQSSRGVTKVWRPEQVPAWFPRAQTASRSGEVLVEELLVGTESSVEAFVDGRGVHTLGICEKVKCPPPFSFDVRLLYPAAFSDEVLAELRRMHERVLQAVGVKAGITHGEYIVTAAGVRLIEVAARGCGAHVATELIPAMTGIDWLTARIRQALGEDPALEEPSARLSGVLEFLLLPPGRVQRVRGLEEARAAPGVLRVDLNVRPGDTIGVTDDASKRSGLILAVGRDRDEVLARAAAARSALGVEVEPSPASGDEERASWR